VEQHRPPWLPFNYWPGSVAGKKGSGARERCKEEAGTVVVVLGGRNGTTGRKCYADGQYLSRRPFIGAVGIGPGLGRGRNSAVGLGMPSA
jgi:hypothetical protein